MHRDRRARSCHPTIWIAHFSSRYSSIGSWTLERRSGSGGDTMKIMRGGSDESYRGPDVPDTATPKEIETAPRSLRGAIFLDKPAVSAPQGGRTTRRALRLRKMVTKKQAALAARLARVGYKTASESGALVVHSKERTWHHGGRANGHAPPPGATWDRSGPVRTTQAKE